jgi:hypothetical protein
MIKICVAIVCASILISCDDKNITVLKKRKINVGARVFFIVDKQGNPVAGASASYQQGKYTDHTASVD